MILLNDFKRQWAETSEDVLQAVRLVGESGWYVLGDEVRKLEQALAILWDLVFCVGVGSGLDALEVGLKALGCGPGDRVVTTPNSAFATTLAITSLGAIPVFVDVDASGQINLQQCWDLMRDQPSIRYAVPVHLYGQPLDAVALASLKDRFGCQMVEDCAQSILALRDGKMTGTVGQVAATSFYPTKNLGALGDGGALLTDDPVIAEAARQLRDYGQDGKYRHTRLGYNSRLDELQAAILRRAFMPRLEGWTKRRRAIAARYRAEIIHPRVRVLPSGRGVDGCEHLFPVLVTARSSFRAFLNERGIMTGEHYPIPIPDQPAMRNVPFEAPFGLNSVRAFSASQVSLPIHPYLREDEISRVIEMVNAWGG